MRPPCRIRPQYLIKRHPPAYLEAMAYCLVRAKPVLERELREESFRGLQPFDPALTRSLRNARFGDGPGCALWEEEDYCRPFLRQEREAVLDRYFTDLSVEGVTEGEEWERIRELGRLFPALADPPGASPGGADAARDGAPDGASPGG